METTTAQRARVSSAVRVRLVDGSTADITNLSNEQLRRLHWEQEQEFARRVMAAPKGSRQRAEVFQQAYDTVVSIMDRYRSGEAFESEIQVPFIAPVLRDQLRRQRRQGEDARLFEIGFGRGTLLKWAADAGYSVAGIDVCSVSHRKACNLLGSERAGALMLGSFLDIRLDGLEGAFGVVSSSEVFEHIPPDEAADFLGRAYRLLRPGGMLITSAPNWHVRPSDVTREWCPPRTEARGLHLKEYTLREITRLLREAGFNRVYTPLFRTSRRLVFCAGGLATWKRLFEPCLELLPYRLARLLCAGLTLRFTLAVKGSN